MLLESERGALGTWLLGKPAVPDSASKTRIPRAKICENAGPMATYQRHPRCRSTSALTLPDPCASPLPQRPRPGPRACLGGKRPRPSTRDCLSDDRPQDQGQMARKLSCRDRSHVVSPMPEGPAPIGARRRCQVQNRCGSPRSTDRMEIPVCWPRSANLPRPA